MTDVTDVTDDPGDRASVSPWIALIVLLIVHTAAGLGIDDPWLRVGVLDLFVLVAAWRVLDLRALFAAGDRGWAILLGLGCAGAMWGAGAVVYRVLSHVDSVWIEQVSEILAWSEGRSLAFVLPMIALTVLCEELAWRGAVALPLTRGLGPMRAGLVATLGYALAHAFAGPPILVLVAFGAGACWTALALWRGHLLAATLCHLAWDLLVFWLAPYA